jgi:hypothetical protein
MAKQTINIGASPNDGTGTPLRTSFDYCNLNFTELYTALGGGVGLPGATTQVIFNDGGTNLAGDAGLVFDKTTDKLTIAGNVQAASATITGDLTVSTAARFNGGATAGYLNGSLFFGSSGNFTNLYCKSSGYVFYNTAGTFSVLNIDNTGVATFQDGAGGTRMTLNSTGLAIGDTAFAGTRLTLRESASNPNALAMTNRNATQTWRIGVDVSAVDDKILGFYDSTSATFRMQLTDTGNVGIGVTPSAWNSSYKALQIGTVGGLSSVTNSMLVSANYYRSASADVYIANGFATIYQQTAGAHQWYNAPSGTAGNAITFTQAMTLDASGNLLVGTTTTSGNAGGLKLSNVSGNRGEITFSNNSGASDYVARFNYGSTPTLVGNITVSSGGTSFVTTSDYRLKESVVPLSGGLARVNALKPSTYKWKADGSNGEGFIAHELAEVVPLAVTGVKDAVNADASINPQGVDLSKVVPVLVAAIQELTARVQTLEAR